MMRTAISPRLAISALWIIPPPSVQRDVEQRLPVGHGLGVLDEDRRDRSAGVGFDLVHDLHRFYDAQGLPLRDARSDLDKWSGVRSGRPIERSDDRRNDLLDVGLGGGRLFDPGRLRRRGGWSG